MPAGRKATGNRGRRLLSPAAAPKNWPDTGTWPARKGADADQVSHWSFKPKEPEPKDKLDAMGGSTAMMASSTARVNGPEDDLDDCGAVDWRTHEDNVLRLCRRIFKATKAGDLTRVRQLQKVMLRSPSD